MENTHSASDNSVFPVDFSPSHSDNSSDCDYQTSRHDFRFDSGKIAIFVVSAEENEAPVITGRYEIDNIHPGAWHKSYYFDDIRLDILGELENIGQHDNSVDDTPQNCETNENQWQSAEEYRHEASDNDNQSFDDRSSDSRSDLSETDSYASVYFSAHCDMTEKYYVIPNCNSLYKYNEAGSTEMPFERFVNIIIYDADKIPHNDDEIIRASGCKNIFHKKLNKMPRPDMPRPNGDSNSVIIPPGMDFDKKPNYGMVLRCSLGPDEKIIMINRNDSRILFDPDCCIRDYKEVQFENSVYICKNCFRTICLNCYSKLDTSKSADHDLVLINTNTTVNL